MVMHHIQHLFHYKDDFRMVSIHNITAIDASFSSVVLNGIQYEYITLWPLVFDDVWYIKCTMLTKYVIKQIRIMEVD